MYPGKVSVIMPNYNYGRYISESIQAVLSQTHGDVELIVIDDCSKDNSVEILREWEKKDPRVIVLANQANRGAAASQNLALEKVSGDFMALCDADDVWYPQKLETQLAIMARNPKVGLVHSQATIVDSQGKSTGQEFTKTYSAATPRKSGNVFDQIIRTNYLCSSSTLLRRECLDYAGEFHTQLRYLYDWTYWVRVARKYEFAFVAEPLLSYRIHGARTALDGPGYNTARITAAELILQAFPDLQSKYQAQLFYLLGTNQLALGRRQNAHSSFANSLLSAPWKCKTWIRWAQTLAATNEGMQTTR